MMNKLSFFNKSNYAFTKEQNCKIIHDLNASNITRIKLFLVFIFDTSIDEAYAIAEKIRLAIQDNVIVTDKIQIKITASFGISLLKDNFSESFDASYKLTNVALYQAKEQGRNKVVIASLDM
ncbi:diguanylate cyclase [Clostridium sp. JS66]|uniref:GGDEF domain-containing protein n=1 Tax=Clostridium sp. JS66 TaxID=3064705 RepID=UPI00298E242A|nr:diguanylate cyclase [Clostridium sp. JS66]WPC43957.1 diguanylate cyclase [Clostridium sp. JS66]